MTKKTSSIFYCKSSSSDLHAPDYGLKEFGRNVSGHCKESFRHLTNYELLKALYIAIVVSPVALLTSKLVTSDTRSRLSLGHLGEVSYSVATLLTTC